MKNHRSERHFGLDHQLDAARYWKQQPRKVSRWSILITCLLYAAILLTFGYLGIVSIDWMFGGAPK